MRIMACVLVLAACGGKNDDWTKKPIKTYAVTVDGQKVTIGLPDGMRQKDDKDEVTFDFLVNQAGENYVKTPEVRIHSGKYAEKTLDDYVKNWGKDVTNWVRKDTLPDGYIASYENPAYKGKEDYIVERHVNGDPGLECSARVTPWTRGDSVKDKLPLIEKMCLSLAPAK